MIAALLAALLADFARGRLTRENFVDQDAFGRWFGESRAVTWNRQGRLVPMPLYHGSPEPDILRFEVQNTSYGYFFAEEPEVAWSYAGGARPGDRGTLYEVYLRVLRPLDLTDPEVRDRFWREVMTDDAPRRHKLDRYREPVEADASDVRDWVEARARQLPAPALATWLEEVRQAYNADVRDPVGPDEDLLSEGGDLACLLEHLEAEDEASVPQARLLELDPEARADLDRELPALRTEVLALEESYSFSTGQGFYRDYQDEVLHMAEANGYDGVIMDDAAPGGGVATSWVVFSPEQVLIIARHPAVARAREEAP